MTLTLRLIKDVEGCDHFTELQRRIWASPESDLVPNHVLVTCIKNGGAILGAYAEDGPPELGGMVGAAYWWLGSGPDPTTHQTRIKACSHMLGVLYAWQGKGIGAALKLAQREAVLAQGLTDWITWTYDPLYLANGIFNIHRLGATCKTYAQNVYGEMQDALNRGVPSDRCQVDWLLNDPGVLRQADRRRESPVWDHARLMVLPSRRRDDAFLEPIDVDLILEGAPIALPIPEDIAAIRVVDGGLSMHWRLYMRHVLEETFFAGYTMVDCVQIIDRGWHYVMAHE